MCVIFFRYDIDRNGYVDYYEFLVKLGGEMVLGDVYGLSI